MAVIELSIENQKDLVVVDKGCNGLCFWPFSSCVEFFGEAIPARLVCKRYLGQVIVQNGLVEMDDKLSLDGEGGFDQLVQSPRDYNHEMASRGAPQMRI